MLMETKCMLIVDDEEPQRQALGGYLKKQGYAIHTAGSGTEAVEIVRQHSVDVVLTDVRMPKMDGFTLLHEIKKINPQIAIVVMTAYSSVKDAVGAMKAGAEDYLQKPIDLEELDMMLARIFERRRMIQENQTLRETLETRQHFSHLVASSPQMEMVLNMAGRAAKSKATVLIRGESGTGKELIARALHLASPRKGNPFITVNIAALNPNLIESELFGHEKGAFTGADKTRDGRFAEADGGTLFIDEIGEIPLNIQAKLLRVLQERTIERIGSNQSRTVDVRVLAATHKDLDVMIKSGDFREDLFFRINVISIHIPPLRERREEIPVLIDHFVRYYCEQEGCDTISLDKSAMDFLMKHDYPGNVRELENMIYRAVVLARDQLIHLEDLKNTLAINRQSLEFTGEGSLPEQVELLEKKLIDDALTVSKGNQSEAARTLGISERHLRYKLKKRL